jgi:hypothetical protein
MMKNYWYDLGNKVTENEVLIYDGSDSVAVFRDMPPRFPIMLLIDEDLREVGLVHTIKLMAKLGIEGVMKCARRYHRRRHELSINKRKALPAFRNARESYWLVIYED